MKHLMFFYLTLSYSIGLPSMVVLVLAFFRSRAKMLLALSLFLLMVTTHLIYLTYVEYRYANTAYWFSNYDSLIGSFLQSSLIVVLPWLVHEWTGLNRRNGVGLIFAGGFLLALILIVVAFLRGLAGDWINLVVLGMLVAAHVYAWVVMGLRFKTFRQTGDGGFAAFLAVFLAVEFSQQVFPIFKTFPENSVIFAAGYFFWNLTVLKYGIERFFLVSSSASLAEVIQKLKLTEREKEILTLLMEGQSNQAIGAKLFISETTVKTHIKNIYRKLDVNNRVQLFNQLNGEKLSG